ncbi:MAG: hypothetical protein Q8R55_05475 [Candidatus Taylorbacteria bacterium]|nr:hypothetical protein [Candidatus Taylorbacteria bacterium]
MYKWEGELRSITNSFGYQITLKPEKLGEHIKEAVKASTDLFQKTIGLDYNEKRVSEALDFLKKSVITLNSLMPKEEPLRLAVKIPLDPPRIETRLIKTEYTLDGHLPLIGDSCPSKEAGECLAIIYLLQFPSVKH